MAPRFPLRDVAEMRDRARQMLPRALFDYICRGTEGETALEALRQGFDRRRIVPRMASGAIAPDSLRGRSPFAIAPTALAGLVVHDGEVRMARAAARAGVPFCVATQSSTSIEDIARGAPGAELWFQLYVWRDRAETWRLLDRVRALGVTTLLVTADTPASPKKVHNQRNGFGIPLRMSPRLAVDFARHPRWLLGVAGRYLLQGGLPSYAHYPGEARAAVTRAIRDPRFALDPVVGPDLLAQLRDRWPGRLIVKGVLDAGDAARLMTLGCDGIVVSSHGGRNHDSAVTPLAMLPAIREAVGPAATVLADSGVMRGSDAAKLIGAGADGVLLGRAPLYGLAAAGEDGALAAIACLEDELLAFLAFSGLADLAALRVAHWMDDAQFFPMGYKLSYKKMKHNESAGWR